MTPSTQQTTGSRVWRRAFGFALGCSYEEGCASLHPILGEMDRFLATLPGLDKKGAGELRLVCDELAANVLRHGSTWKNIAAEVEVRADDDRVRLRFRDDGPPFNLYAQGDPYIGPDMEKRLVGGLGLYLIRQLFPDGRHVREGEWNVCEVEIPLHAHG